MENNKYDKYLTVTEHSFIKKLGRVVKMVGLTIESLGPDANLNDLCIIRSAENKNQVVFSEVVGFRDRKVLLMPYGNMDGIGPVRLLKIQVRHSSLMSGSICSDKFLTDLG